MVKAGLREGFHRLSKLTIFRREATSDMEISEFPPEALSAAENPEYDPDLTFGELLFWHLFKNGTRPVGPFKKWNRKRFAADVEKTPRAVGNWFKNQGAPYDLGLIEKALFGDNKDLNQWRLDLHYAFAAIRKSIDLCGPGRISEAKIEHFDTLPLKIERFASRDSYINQIKSYLLPQSDIEAKSPVILHGIAGIGKTALAVEFAYRYRKYFAGVWWCSAENSDCLIISLKKLAVYLELCEQRVDNQLAALKALKWLDQQAQPWLLVYDDARNNKEIQYFLSVYSRYVLITSRFPDWAHVGVDVRLKTFSITSGADLLEDIACRKDRESAELLADALGGLPLALSHAAVTCRRTRMSFKEYLDNFEVLLKNLPENVDYPKSAYATLELAIKAASFNNSAVRLISCLGYFGNEPIPTELVENLFCSKEEEVEAVLTLIQSSLVSIERINGKYDCLIVHKLVRFVMRDKITRQENGILVLDDVIEVLYEMLRTSIYAQVSTYDLLSILSSHVLSIRNSSAKALQKSRTYLDLLIYCAKTLHDLGLSLEAKNILREASEICTYLVLETGFGYNIYFEDWHLFLNPTFHDEYRNMSLLNKDYDILYSLFNASLLGAVIEETTIPQNLNECVSNHQLASACVLILNGPHSSETFDVLINFGRAQIKFGYIDEGLKVIDLARDLYNRAENIADFFTKRFSLIKFLVLFPNGEDQIEAINLQIETISEEIRATSSDFASLLLILGQAQTGIENHADAIASFKKSYQIRRRIFGALNSEATTSLHQLGLAFIRLGKVRKGKIICSCAYQTLADIQGENAPLLKHYKQELEECLVDYTQY